MSAKSTTAGSPRRFAPRDDGIVQRFLECLNRCQPSLYEFFSANGHEYLETLRAHKDEIEHLDKLQGARNIRVFGSVARTEDASGSDIDFLTWKNPAAFSIWSA